MHPIVCSLIGLVGMSTCLWVMNDVFRIIVLDCMMWKHKVQSRILASSWAAAHTRMMMKVETIDVCMEEFQEVVIETVEPFLE